MRVLKSKSQSCNTVWVEASWVVGATTRQMTNLSTDETFCKWKLTFNPHNTSHVCAYSKPTQ